MEIRTKEELKRAQQEGAEEIVVVGKLASQLYAARKIKTLSKASLGIITSTLGIGALAALPTGGLSLGISGLAVAPVGSYNRFVRRITSVNRCSRCNIHHYLNTRL